MALRDNSLTKTNEELFRASVIEMTKILKMERRQHSLYQQPMRMFVGVDIQKWSTPNGDGTYTFNPFDAKCEFIKMLDPIHTHMYIENTFINFQNIAINIVNAGLFIKSITSPYSYDSSGGRFWGLLPGFTPRPLYNNTTDVLVQTTTIGLPLSDVNFTNNNILTFDLRGNIYVNGLNETPFIYTPVKGDALTFSLLFYRHTPLE